MANSDKVRNLLNIIFLIGTLVSLIVYFVADDKKVFLYVCGATIFTKIVEYVIRFTGR